MTVKIFFNVFKYSRHVVSRSHSLFAYVCGLWMCMWVCVVCMMVSRGLCFGIMWFYWYNLVKKRWGSEFFPSLSMQQYTICRKCICHRIKMCDDVTKNVSDEIDFYLNCPLTCIVLVGLHCPKKNPNFRDITWNKMENIILDEIFRVVSRFPRYACHGISRKIDFLRDSVFIQYDNRCWCRWSKMLFRFWIWCLKYFEF